MNEVNINKNKLLSILMENKLTHIANYKEAEQDYIDAVLIICTNNLKLAEYGIIKKFGDIKPIPTKPVSYETDYNKAIRMLELSIDNNIALSKYEFSQLVLDEWEWKHDFKMSSMNYKTLKG